MEPSPIKKKCFNGLAYIIFVSFALVVFVGLWNLEKWIDWNYSYKSHYEAQEKRIQRIEEQIIEIKSEQFKHSMLSE